AMARVARSTRIPGAPHCRKCNYCLHEFKGDRCPECNHSTKHPRTGRPRWRRLLPWSAALIALAAFYLCLWVADAPRVGWVHNYFQIWSPGILEWATQKNIGWLIARGVSTEEIIEYDINSKKQRTVFQQKSFPNRIFSSMQLTPDGTGLVLPLSETDEMAVIDP